MVMRLRTSGRSIVARSQGRGNARSRKNQNRKEQRRYQDRSRAHRRIIGISGSKSNFYNIIEPILNVMQIFGLAPYEFFKDGRTIRMRPSNRKCLYSLLCIIICSFVVIIQTTQYQALHLQKPTTAITVIGKMILNFLVLVTDLTLEIARRERFAHLCNRLADFDKGSIGVGDPFSQKIKRRVWMFMVASVPGWTIVFVASVAAFKRKSLDMFLYMLNYIGSSLGVFKLCGMLFFIGRCFACLNDAAHDVGLRVGGRVRAKEVINLYDQLMDTSEKLNNMYSWSLLLFVFNLFCHTIVNIFFIMASITSSYKNFMNTFSLFIWLTVYMTQLLLLLVVCHFVSSKANHMPRILLDWRRRDDRPSKQNVLRTNLHFFNRRLTFSAGGCFDVHLPLLTSMFSNFTTYLVILLQLPRDKYGT